MLNKALSNDIYNSPIKELIEKGLDPNEIFECIKFAFNPFFQNKDNLIKYTNPYLITEFIGYCRNYYNSLNDNIKNIISLFNNNKKTDEIFIMNLFKHFLIDDMNVIEKTWSTYFLQHKLDELEINEYVTELFRIIEDICENNLKNYFRYLCCLQKKDISILSKIKENKTFGSLVIDLSKKLYFKKLLKIIPTDLKLNDWRNIACHKDYEIKNGKIICKYGKKRNKIITLNNKTDLFYITKGIYKILNTLKLSFNIFIFDNLEQINSKLDSNAFSPQRKEVWITSFISYLLLYGFQVVNLEKIEGKLVIEVRDLTKGNIQERSIQSSKIIYLAWFYSSEKIIEVIYKNNENISVFKTSANDDICKKIDSKEKTINYLAETMDIIILNPNIFYEKEDSNE